MKLYINTRLAKNFSSELYDTVYVVAVDVLCLYLKVFYDILRKSLNLIIPKVFCNCIPQMTCDIFLESVLKKLPIQYSIRILICNNQDNHMFWGKDCTNYFIMNILHFVLIFMHTSCSQYWTVLTLFIRHLICHLNSYLMW